MSSFQNCNLETQLLPPAAGNTCSAQRKVTVLSPAGSARSCPSQSSPPDVVNCFRTERVHLPRVKSPRDCTKYIVHAWLLPVGSVVFIWKRLDSKAAVLCLDTSAPAPVRKQKGRFAFRAFISTAFLGGHRGLCDDCAGTAETSSGNEISTVAAQQAPFKLQPFRNNCAQKWSPRAERLLVSPLQDYNRAVLIRLVLLKKQKQ